MKTKRRSPERELVLEVDTIETAGPMATPCQVWRWAKTWSGYGRVLVGGRRTVAHRVFYEKHRGPIPHGMTIDHLCRNRLCQNPWHLEVVTNGENVLRGESPPATNARKTTCPAGHRYDEVNTYRRHNRRHCRICMSENHRKYVAENRDHVRELNRAWRMKQMQGVIKPNKDALLQQEIRAALE